MNLWKLSQHRFLILLIAGTAAIILAFLLFRKFVFISKTPSVSFSPSPLKLAIPCPVPAQFCQKVIMITYEGRKVGWGFTLPPETPITAVFEGTLEEGSEEGGPLQIKTHPVRWLHGRNEFKGYIATYSFYGKATSAYGEDKVVKLFDKGEKVAITESDSFPEGEPFYKINLLFSLSKGDKFGEPIDFSFE